MFETGRGPAGGERACPVRGHPHAVRGTGRNRPIRVMIPGVRGQEAGPCPRSGSSPCLVGPSGQDRSRHPSESSPWRGRSVGTVLGAFRSGASPPCGADSRRDPMPILAPGCSLVVWGCDREGGGMDTCWTATYLVTGSVLCTSAGVSVPWSLGRPYDDQTVTPAKALAGLAAAGGGESQDGSRVRQPPALRGMPVH